MLSERWVRINGHLCRAHGHSIDDGAGRGRDGEGTAALFSPATIIGTSATPDMGGQQAQRFGPGASTAVPRHAVGTMIDAHCQDPVAQLFGSVPGGGVLVRTYPAPAVFDLAQTAPVVACACAAMREDEEEESRVTRRRVEHGPHEAPPPIEHFLTVSRTAPSAVRQRSYRAHVSAAAAGMGRSQAPVAALQALQDVASANGQKEAAAAADDHAVPLFGKREQAARVRAAAACRVIQLFRASVSAAGAERSFPRAAEEADRGTLFGATIATSAISATAARWFARSRFTVATVDRLLRPAAAGLAVPPTAIGPTRDFFAIRAPPEHTLSLLMAPSKWHSGTATEGGAAPTPERPAAVVALILRQFAAHATAPTRRRGPPRDGESASSGDDDDDVDEDDIASDVTPDGEGEAGNTAPNASGSRTMVRVGCVPMAIIPSLIARLNETRRPTTEKDTAAVDAAKDAKRVMVVRLPHVVRVGSAARWVGAIDFDPAVVHANAVVRGAAMRYLSSVEALASACSTLRQATLVADAAAKQQLQQQQQQASSVSLLPLSPPQTAPMRLSPLRSAVKRIATEVAVQVQMLAAHAQNREEVLAAAQPPSSNQKRGRDGAATTARGPHWSCDHEQVLPHDHAHPLAHLRRALASANISLSQAFFIFIRNHLRLLHGMVRTGTIAVPTPNVAAITGGGGGASPTTTNTTTEPGPPQTYYFIPCNAATQSLTVLEVWLSRALQQAQRTAGALGVDAGAAADDTVAPSSQLPSGGGVVNVKVENSQRPASIGLPTVPPALDVQLDRMAILMLPQRSSDEGGKEAFCRLPLRSCVKLWGWLHTEHFAEVQRHASSGVGHRAPTRLETVLQRIADSRGIVPSAVSSVALSRAISSDTTTTNTIDRGLSLDSEPQPVPAHGPQDDDYSLPLLATQDSQLQSQTSYVLGTPLSNSQPPTAGSRAHGAVLNTATDASPAILLRHPRQGPTADPNAAARSSSRQQYDPYGGDASLLRPLPAIAPSADHLATLQIPGGVLHSDVIDAWLAIALHMRQSPGTLAVSSRAIRHNEARRYTDLHDSSSALHESGTAANATGVLPINLSAEEFAAASELWIPALLAERHWVLFQYRRRREGSTSVAPALLPDGTHTYEDSGFTHNINVFDALALYTRGDGAATSRPIRALKKALETATDELCDMLLRFGSTPAATSSSSDPKLPEPSASSQVHMLAEQSSPSGARQPPPAHPPIRACAFTFAAADWQVRNSVELSVEAVPDSGLAVMLRAALLALGIPTRDIVGGARTSSSDTDTGSSRRTSTSSGQSLNNRAQSVRATAILPRAAVGRVLACAPHTLARQEEVIQAIITDALVP